MSFKILMATCLVACARAKVVEISWGFDTSQANQEITAGDTVTWNFDQAGNPEHSVTAYDNSFDSGLLVTGQYSRTFDTVGEFGYFCLPHSFMSGTITVVAAPKVCEKMPKKKNKCRKQCQANGMDFKKFKVEDGCPVCKCACRERVKKNTCLSGDSCVWVKKEKLFGSNCRGTCHSCSSVAGDNV